MTLGRIAVLVGVALLVMLANVAISVLYMVVYGHAIEPGHEQAYYEAHVKVAAPYCSIVAGIPLMFVFGWWISHWWGGRLGVQSALIVWLAYAIIDLAIVIMASGLTVKIGVVVAISLLTKLGAAFLGALTAGRPT